MGSVRNLAGGAWVSQGVLYLGDFRRLTVICPRLDVPRWSVTLLGVTVPDLLYIGLTIVVFAVLLLILKGVERFER
jgi:hypothetical protein